MLCATLEVTELADGTVLAHYRPSQAGDGDTCGGGWIIENGEAEQLRALLHSPTLFTMSAEDGVAYSGAIVALWAIAWAIKAVRRAL